MRARLSSCCGLLLLLVSLLFPPALEAKIITVRQDGTGDHLTIAGAVAVASAGDTIEVGLGTYAESNVVHIPLTFISTNGPGLTTIDGQGSDRHLLFLGGIGSEVIGFKFVNGYASVGSSSGGSIRVLNGTTLTIRDCEFENNRSDFDGGAVFVAHTGSVLEVEDCVFVENFAAHNGAAGNSIQGSILRFDNCTFLQNSSDRFSGAVACDHGTMDIERCLFVGNVSGDVTGAVYYYESSGLVKSNTFYQNTSPGSVAGTIVMQSSSSTNVTQNIITGETAGYGLRYYQGTGAHSCNLFWDNADGPSNEPLLPNEVAADPIFCDPLAGGFDISIHSKAAAANNSCGLLFGAFPATCDIEPPPGSVEEPVITSILDVGNDQGRQVRLKWNRSLYDAPGDGVVITGYAIYRRQDLFLVSGPTETTSEADRPDRATASAGWDYIVTVPARGNSTYQYVAPTLCDSTKTGGICWSVFFVSALTPDPLVFYDSDPDSGYSIDNIRPVSPSAFSVTYNTGSGNALSWDPSEDEDFAGFCVYRGTDPGFAIGPGNLVHSTIGTEWLDPVAEGWKYHYKITAEDDAGNESDPSSPDVMTGIDMPLTPKAFALYQNVPNPFNPATVIEYDVGPEGGHVGVSIYDVSGRLVRRLVDAVQPNGRKRVTWDGRDDSGRRVASGVYFYRLRSAQYTKTMKMTLVQ